MVDNQAQIVLSSYYEYDINLAEPENLEVELKVCRVMPDANGAFRDLAFLNLCWYMSQV